MSSYSKEKMREYQKSYREKNREKLKEYQEKNKEKIKEYNKQYYKDNKEKIKQYYISNREEKINKSKQYYKDNKDKCSKLGKDWYEANKDKIKQYQESRKDSISEYRKKYQEEHKKELRQKAYNKRQKNKRLIQQYKESHPCIVCGHTNPDHLHFHHIDKTNKKNVSKLMGCSWKRIEQEIDKCEVLCICCHRDRHKEEVSQPSNTDNREYIRKYKESHPCIKCGQTNPNYLDFHHTNPLEKDGDITKLQYGGLEKLILEIDKCIVLCAYCHADAHKVTNC